MIFILMINIAAGAKIFSQHYDLAQEIVNSMSLDQKIGQTLQIDYVDITRGGKTDYAKIKSLNLGSVLIGGNGCPDNNANIQDQDYSTATMANWQKVAANSLSQTTDVTHPDGQVKIKPLLGTDAVHGNQHVLGSILFPHNIGLAASHNPQNFNNAAKWNRISVKKSGFNFAFAPTVAVSHNFQWGRFYETLGTDPFQVYEYTKEYVKSIQNVQDKYILGVLASTKHFLGDGATFNGHDEGNNRVKNLQVFLDHNFKGYIAALEENTATIMVSYSAINDLAMSINPLMNTLLKGTYGFDGFLISDYNAVRKTAYQGLPTTNITMPEDEAYIKSFENGMDMQMLGDGADGYIVQIKNLVNSNKIQLSRINDAVKRILAVKLSLGIVDIPQTLATKYNYKYPQANEEEVNGDDEYADSLKAAQESLVLLLNRNNLIPVQMNQVKHIILIGERILTINGKPQLYQDFDNIGAQNGGWSVRWQGYNGNKYWSGDLKTQTKATSILDALKTRFPDAIIHKTDYTSTTDWDLIGQAREKFWNFLISQLTSFNRQNTIIINTLAENPYAEFMGDVNVEFCKGTTQQVPGCIYNVHINEYQPDQQQTSLTINFDSEAERIIGLVRTSDIDIPIITVLFSGRPYITNDVFSKSNAFIAAWLPGTQGGEAVVSSIFGDYLFRQNDLANTLPVPWLKSQDSLINFPNYGDTVPTLENVLYPDGYGLKTSLKEQQEIVQ